MTMTATQLLSASFPSVKKAANYVLIHNDVVPSFVNNSKNKLLHKAPKINVSVSSTADMYGEAKRGPIKKHKVQIISLNSDSKLHVAPLLVRCSCDYFTFNCEVALTKKGASSIKQSNGDKPVIRNPHMVPSVCKHLYKVLTVVLRRKM